MVKEWNMLRVVACLSVVLLHSTTQTIYAVGAPKIINYDLYRILLCYATPTFILLSIVILANKYQEGLPRHFWPSRLKWILAPYVAFGLIDSFVLKIKNPYYNLEIGIMQHIFQGKFVGWFILVIFQFYILYYIVNRFKLSMTYLLPISMVVMFSYLYFLKHIPQHLVPYSHYLRLPFIAWFGYFTVGYLVGKHYKKIAAILLKWRVLTVVAVLVSVIIIYLSYKSGYVVIHSRRLDLFFLVISSSALVIAWGQLVPNYKWITLLSNYSFGIYLMHWQIQTFIAPYTAQWFSHTSTRVVSLFTASLVLSLIIIKIISTLPFGSYIVGNVKRSKKIVIHEKKSLATGQ
ncbi:acyltransferase [Bacillus sp. HMF5848]|uniref:acyltransferase family protein n=1 Tax=Bacillus sp. HMF5848 TaxID=2495421 RepID=UPI000F790E57|nr:acyltransferase family protein [Bacillus sp. HMF5848]RSK28717.1 acyltransferase [Bacillus sp. HMF5848]